MKIRMLVSISGMDFALSPGDETERFSQAECVRMIENGSAVPVSAPKVEKAVDPDPEEVREDKPVKGKRR